MDKKAGKLDLVKKVIRPGTVEFAKNIVKQEAGYSGPFFAWPILRAFGKKAPQKVWGHVERPLLKLDEKAGKVLSKPIGRYTPEWFSNMFKEVEYIPPVKRKIVKEKINGKTVSKKVWVPDTKSKRYLRHEYHTALGPMKKATGVAAMLAAPYGIEKMLEKPKPNEKKINPLMYADDVANISARALSKKASAGGTMSNNKELIKRAADAIKQRTIELHEAREKITSLEKEAELVKKASQLVFDMIKRGLMPDFKGDFEVYQEKVAELMKEDLAVAEKALQFQGKIAELGEVSTISRGGNALEEFVLNG